MARASCPCSVHGRDAHATGASAGHPARKLVARASCPCSVHGRDAHATMVLQEPHLTQHPSPASPGRTRTLAMKPTPDSMTQSIDIENVLDFFQDLIRPKTTAPLLFTRRIGWSGDGKVARGSIHQPRAAAGRRAGLQRRLGRSRAKRARTALPVARRGVRGARRRAGFAQGE